MQVHFKDFSSEKLPVVRTIQQKIKVYLFLNMCYYLFSWTVALIKCIQFVW